MKRDSNPRGFCPKKQCRILRRHKCPLVCSLFLLRPPPCIRHRRRSAPSPIQRTKETVKPTGLAVFLFVLQKGLETYGFPEKQSACTAAPWCGALSTCCFPFLRFAVSATGSAHLRHPRGFCPKKQCRILRRHKCPLVCSLFLLRPPPCNRHRRRSAPSPIQRTMKSGYPKRDDHFLFLYKKGLEPESFIQPHYKTKIRPETCFGAVVFILYFCVPLHTFSGVIGRCLCHVPLPISRTLDFSSQPNSCFALSIHLSRAQTRVCSP